MGIHDLAADPTRGYFLYTAKLESTELQSWITSVTVGDSRSYNLKSVYFARTLRLNVLDIWNCTFGESHPVWNLVTAPLLSDSLEHIWVLSAADDPERALKQLALPPALLLSAYLGHLQELRVALWRLSCERERDVALSHLLSRLPADRIANIEIVYRCPHRSPHLDRWKLLFSVLDDVIATTHFSSLTTITMALHTLYSLDVDYTRAAVDSLPFSRIWAETFTMSSISLTSPGADETCSVNRRVSERAEALAEAHTERITLTLELGLPLRPEHKTTVLYVRRPSL
ncbi:hypothetical protein CERSUDRAFT_109845 [Gelatoporia subvermispora B]|uniref:Uncharacterized protein n=1 Tax=Ceriporiopsis subvermispora (strain B) TaxID=914234 RepID=M2RQP4_CERS8|nr:hypothetical protein CERSUDRAFT_109845 [Gelatoporia subvermispora B]